MKHLFTFLLVFGLFWTNAYSQIYIDESFDSEIPATWTTSSEQDANPWYWVDGLGFETLDGSGYVMVDPDGAGAANNLVENLETPGFDASAGNIVIVQFDQYYGPYWQGLDSGTVQVWDGAVWNNAYVAVSTIGAWGNPVSTTVIITDFVNPSGDTKVRFHYDDGNTWAFYWAIDNVVISSVDCLEPQQLVINQLSATDYELSWESGSGTSNVAYGPQGFDINDIAGSGGVLVSSVTSPYVITGIDELSFYDVYVQDDCGGSTSGWSGPITFFTSVNGPGTTCDDPIILNNNLPYVSPEATICGYGNNINISNCFPFTTTNEEILFAYSPETDGEVLAISLANLSGNYAFISVLDGCPDNVDASCIASIQSAFGESSVLLDGIDVLSGEIYYIMISTYSWNECLTFDLSINLVTCPTPSALSAVSNSDGSAELNWTSNSAATEFEVEWGIAGFTLGTGTLVAGTYGVDGPPVSIDGLSSENNYEFYITDFCGFGDNSLPAGPFEFSGPPPANDQCADAISIECGDFVVGNTSAATTIGNPTDFCGTSMTAPSVWYSFIGTGDDVTLSTDGSNYDTKLFLFSGDCGNLVCIDGDDDGGAGLQSYIYSPTEAGVTYYVIVSGFSQNTGLYNLEYNCVTCPLISGLIVSVSDVSANINWTTTNDGADYYLEYGPAGFTPGTGTMLSGIVGTDGPSVDIDGLTSGNSYDVYVHEECTLVDITNELSGTFTTNPLPPPANDDICNAIALVEGEILQTTNLYASVQAGEPVPPATGCQDPEQMGWCISSISNTTWYSFTPELNGMSVISTCFDGSYDTQIAVYTGDCNDLSTLELVAANDDQIGGCTAAIFASTVSVCLEGGVTYYIQVDPYSSFGNGANFPISIEYEEAAIINLIDVVSNTQVTIDWEYFTTSGTDADFLVLYTNVLTGDTGSFYGNTADLPIVIDGLDLNAEYEYSIYCVDDCNTMSGPNYFVTVGIGELTFGRNINIYPNPVLDKLTIEINAEIKKGTSISILNMQGQSIYQNTINNNVSEYRSEIDMSNYARGVYMLKVEDENASIQQRIIVQ